MARSKNGSIVVYQVQSNDSNNNINNNNINNNNNNKRRNTLTKHKYNRAEFI